MPAFEQRAYALMIEDDLEQKIESKKKTYAPVVFGSKTFSSSQIKMSSIRKIISSYLLFIPRVWTFVMGKHIPSNSVYRQQISNTLLPNKDHTSNIVERMRLRHAI